MTGHVSYAVKIKTDFNLKETVRVYREAVGFFLDVAIKEWDLLFLEDTSKKKIISWNDSQLKFYNRMWIIP